MADSVATFVLGVISNNLWDVKDDQDKYLLEITAFWAPFLLLHLGGPDTITAYSLEDNELWLRHLLALGFQSVAVIYIWIVAGTGSQLYVLSILMFFPGIIKYGERIWVLWLASNGKLRESLLSPPDPGPNYYKFSREYTLKQSEGYHVTVKKIEDQSMIPLIENEFIPDGAELVTAYDLLQIFKNLFADLILGFDDRNHSQSLFNKISSDKAFRMMEMELGFMLWLTKHATTCIGQAISFIQQPEQPRWSNSMSQFNLLSFSLKDKQTICYGIQKLLRIDKMLENNRNTTCETVTVYLKEFIFEYLKEKFDHLKRSSNDENVLRTLCSFRADLCYHLDWRDQEPAMSNVKFSNWLSQYMLYLLVICPSMLPMGIGMIRLQDTSAEVTRFFEDHEYMADSVDYSHRSRNTCLLGVNCFLSGEPTFDKYQACEILSKVNTPVLPAKVKGDRSKSVLFDACRLASKLQAIEDKNQKWEMITRNWVEMLAYAACHCRGNYHAKQLSQGGELLTHVWLLMAHFGINEQFQISQGHARVKLVV
nr:hypothetical protein CFP56_49292 [Quercus suber]